LSERWLTGSLLVLAAGYLVVATSIPLDPWAAEEIINTRTLPVIYGATLALISLVLLARSAGRRVSHTHRRALVVGLVTTLVVFATAVALIGVWLAIPILLIVAMMLLGERRWWLLCVIPAATSLLAWALVTQLLGVVVPSGILSG
jgi:hypothetical protein